MIRVKEKIALSNNQFEEDEEQKIVSAGDDIRLIIPGSKPTVLHNEDLLSDHYDTLKKVEINGILHFVLKVSDNEYEAVDIVSTESDDGN